MPAQIARARAALALSAYAALGAAALTAAALAAATAARADTNDTTATVAPVLHPNRLGARGAVSVTVRFAAPGAVVPAALRRLVLRFPAGMTLEVPHLRSCSRARLQARGPSGCPTQSLLGHGHALTAAYIGSQTTTESIELWLFLGPPRNLRPTVELLGQGLTPFDKRVVLSGSVLADGAPYGEQLVLPIPPVTTLPLEPDASILTLSLTVGTASRRGGTRANTVRAPQKCPAGGFPLAGEFTYADGSRGSTRAAMPCP